MDLKPSKLCGTPMFSLLSTRTKTTIFSRFLSHAICILYICRQNIYISTSKRINSFAAETHSCSGIFQTEAKMSSSTRSSSATLILLSAVLLLSSTTTTTSAFNITHILERYPDFSEFNSLLTKSDLVAEINRRKTITVLALTNDRIGEIAGKPEDVLKRILSTHVVLDYYDLLKLNKLKDTKTVLTTLYQASGVADDQQGFLDVIHKKDGSIVFGSAMPGSPHDIKLEGTVASQPYNISVLSISHPIIAPGIDGTYRPVSAPPPKVITPPPTSEVSPPAETPEEEPVADEPTADAPQPSEAPADAPVADAPSADADDSQTAPPPPNSAAKKHMISGVSLALVVALVLFQAAH